MRVTTAPIFSVSGGGLDRYIDRSFGFLSDRWGFRLAGWLQKQGSAETEGGCEGANDEDECMMRRTLNAHTDYIYTQQHHN